MALLPWLRRNHDAILAGVVSSAIVVLAQVVVPSLRQILIDAVTHRLVVRRVWGMRRPKRVYIVSGSIEHLTTASGTAFLAGPDAEAVAVLQVAVQLVFPKAEVVHLFSPGFSPDLYKSDVICVGGPINNTCTREFLGGLSLESHFDATKLVTKLAEYEPGAVEGSTVVTDYGFVVAAPNPFAHDRRCVVVAGCDTHGVLAAANALSPGDNARSFRAAVAKAQPLLTRLGWRGYAYQAVVETKGFANTTGPLSVREVSALPKAEPAP